MGANLKFLTALAVLIWIGLGLMTIGASAETVEVARKCDALTAKAYPPRVIGNPAAGSAYGTGYPNMTIIRSASRMDVT